jgi:hypothetical protein
VTDLAETHGNGKLVDFNRDPTYERRVVAFFDFLGWSDRIKKASDDPKKLGALRRVVLRHARNMQFREQFGFIGTTFSDSTVISQSLEKSPNLLVQQIAIFQVAAAINGFWLRGGITIGNIVHDDECVFGPALNRAYELECSVANYPRVVLDQTVIAEFGNLGDLPVLEEDVWFLEPFTTSFLNYMTNNVRPVATTEELLNAGLRAPGQFPPEITPEMLLGTIHDGLKKEIRSPLRDKEWNKLAWLFDRLSDRLGVPPARSYPREYPPA